MGDLLDEHIEYVRGEHIDVVDDPDPSLVAVVEAAARVRELEEALAWIANNTTEAHIHHSAAALVLAKGHDPGCTAENRCCVDGPLLTGRTLGDKLLHEGRAVPANEETAE